jgi:hypothetical protein
MARPRHGSGGNFTGIPAILGEKSYRAFSGEVAFPFAAENS